MRYHDEHGRLMEASDAELKELDRREGRERVPSKVAEATVGLCGAMLIIEENTARIEQTARKFGVYGLLRSAAGLMRKAINIMLNRVSARQNLSIRENTRGLIVQFSPRPTPMTYNMPMSDLLTLTAYALDHCRCECTHTESEARACPLRAVLSIIPRIDYDDDGIGLCPYMGAAVRGEDEA